MQRFMIQGRWVGQEEYQRLSGLSAETSVPVEVTKESPSELEKVVEKTNFTPTIKKVVAEKESRAKKTEKQIPEKVAKKTK